MLYPLSYGGLKISSAFSHNSSPNIVRIKP
jgi:hypothetical protein